MPLHFLSCSLEIIFSYDPAAAFPNGERRCHKSITVLELSLLWALLLEREWDDSILDEFHWVPNHGGRVIFGVPSAMVSQLARLDDCALEHVASAWAATKDPVALQNEADVILRDLVFLAQQSLEKNRQLYLCSGWIDLSFGGSDGGGT